MGSESHHFGEPYSFVHVVCSSRFAIPLSSDLFSGAAAAAKPHDSAIPVVSGMGAVNKDVQPKSPGLDDEDDDEGASETRPALVFEDLCLQLRVSENKRRGMNHT